MRTTVDIPDPIYRKLKTKAVTEKTSVRALILRGVESALQDPATLEIVPRLSEPIVNTGIPGSLKLDNKRIYELIGFP